MKYFNWVIHAAESSSNVIVLAFTNEKLPLSMDIRYTLKKIKRYTYESYKYVT